VISFVVPAYNEERLLPRALEAIHQAAREAGEPYEIVVADDASTDATAALAAAHGARVAAVSCRQIAATRNAGARAATGDPLIFVDADTFLDARVLRAALTALQAGAVGGGAGVTFDGPVPLYARLVLAFTVWAFRLTRLAAGCFIFCRREAFERVGGFDERYFGGEELFLSRALARQGRFVVLRERVVTSGRKVRAYSGWEVFRTMARLGLHGTRAVRSRKHLDFWYGERREEEKE
jgi:glycosyltransferase involved in cell wall biosynthesis